MTLALDPTAQNLLFHEAHTASSFTEQPVSDAQIQEIYELVRLAPTAFNQSPLRLTLLRTPEARERLVRHMAEGNRAKTTAAPLTALLSVDLHFHERLPELLPHAPRLKDTVFAEPESRERAGSLNAALQAGYFILGVRAAGLAAGPMTGFDHAAVDREFFGDGRQRVLLAMNIGVPAPDAYRPRAPRLAAADALTTL
ncbi:malonic semialdehyde reductase [Streptomyces sp. AJS327]|uniref:malonic semialdehyde reductase n=1 Tax=Streptomyces sp. AJS327 TaxID=2545265 RepID=UPI0015DF287A|nr:malonic semialdehyde reductase [Streptomyces sp. AJS327]MBA0051347.1 malonic semialdehyde reductase [Streptomyces sp. AJS327]